LKYSDIIDQQHLPQEVELLLSFDKIMTSQVMFYDNSFEAECVTYCKERNITYLPSLENFEVCYTLDADKFEDERITDNQKVNVNEDMFDKSVLEKFKVYHILFVFDRNELVGGVRQICG
jgi:hypothetical protein